MNILSFLLFPASRYCDGEIYKCLSEIGLTGPLGQTIQVNVMACCVTNKEAIPNLLELTRKAFSKQLRSPESLGILAWTGWCHKQIENNPSCLQNPVPNSILQSVNKLLHLSLNPNEAIWVGGAMTDYLSYRQSLV